MVINKRIYGNGIGGNIIAEYMIANSGYKNISKGLSTASMLSEIFKDWEQHGNKSRDV